jgi:hypothetical protein
MCKQAALLYLPVPRLASRVEEDGIEARLIWHQTQLAGINWGDVRVWFSAAHAYRVHICIGVHKKIKTKMI